VSDLEQFFRQLVANLAATDPHRLHQQIQVAEIQRDILPYRANRRALGLESSEDYEVLLLRLCAGEGGFARLEPPELQARLQTELAGTNPDLGLLRAHGDALVWLGAAEVARLLADHPHASYVPPAVPPVVPAAAARQETLGGAFHHTDADILSTDRELPLDAAPAGPPSSEPATSGMCLYCGGALPAGRAVNFCPHCGQSQRPLQCPSCQADVEYGWRHCVNCGALLGEG
jgi:Double zinc ribbon